MLDLLGGGIFGSLIGGIFRLAPEVLKWLDKKNERQHELAMFQRQCELEAQRGQQKLAEIGAQREAAIDSGVMDAFNAAIQQQTEMVKAAGGLGREPERLCAPGCDLLDSLHLVLCPRLVCLERLAERCAAG